MPKYKVHGTIELNWEKVLEADSKEEAEELAKDYANDGWVELGMAVDDPEVHQVEEVKQ